MQDATSTEIDADQGLDVAALQAEVQQLRTALKRRPVIDMAKGAIMVFTRCDEDAAFRTLSDVSQTHNVKLFDLATALVADLPHGADGVEGQAGQLVARLWTRGEPQNS